MSFFAECFDGSLEGVGDILQRSAMCGLRTYREAGVGIAWFVTSCTSRSSVSVRVWRKLVMRSKASALIAGGGRGSCFACFTASETNIMSTRDWAATSSSQIAFSMNPFSTPR